MPEPDEGSPAAPEQPTTPPADPAPTAGGLVRCHHAFALPAPPGGSYNRMIHVGDVFDATDPVVQGRLGAYFEPIEEAAERSRVVVEQATAAPGEQRTTGRRGGRSKKGS